MGREMPKEIAIGPEMVVNDIKNYTEAKRMSAVDESFHVVRPTVEPSGREHIHTVVAPAPSSRKIGERHHFDNCNSEAGQFIELPQSRLESAFWSESSNVQFADDLILACDTFPIVISPAEGGWVD